MLASCVRDPTLQSVYNKLFSGDIDLMQQNAVRCALSDSHRLHTGEKASTGLIPVITTLLDP